MLEIADFTKLYVALPIFIARFGRRCSNGFVAEKETWAMKRIVIWSCVAVLVVIAGVAIAGAAVRGRHGCFGHRWGAHFGPMGYVAHELKLNDAQREQIRSMWQTEKPAISELVHELAAEGKEMDAATAKGNLDEGKVQEIATRQGATIAKLLVEKEHFKSKVYTTVLTPEQRDKADELQARWHERLDQLGNFPER
jgi:Spy/CpxP family protein refolding chaperone